MRQILGSESNDEARRNDTLSQLDLRRRLSILTAMLVRHSTSCLAFADHMIALKDNLGSEFVERVRGILFRERPALQGK